MTAKDYGPMEPPTPDPPGSPCTLCHEHPALPGYTTCWECQGILFENWQGDRDAEEAYQRMQNEPEPDSVRLSDNEIPF